MQQEAGTGHAHASAAPQQSAKLLLLYRPWKCRLGDAQPYHAARTHRSEMKGVAYLRDQSKASSTITLSLKWMLHARLCLKVWDLCLPLIAHFSHDLCCNMRKYTNARSLAYIYTCTHIYYCLSIVCSLPYRCIITNTQKLLFSYYTAHSRLTKCRIIKRA